MEDNNTPAKRFPLKRVIIAVCVVAAVGLMVFFLRGPYISNFLKMAILSEVSSATGRQVIARRIFVNLYPLSIEARDVKGFSLDGARLFSVGRVKAYVSLTDILRRRVTLDRIVLVKPEVWADATHIKEILENLKTFSGQKKKLIDVKAGAVNILHGNVSYHDESTNTAISIVDLDAEILLRDKTQLSFSIKRIETLFDGGRKIQAAVKGIAIIDGNALVIKDMNMDSGGAGLHARGSYSKGDNGLLDISASVPIAALREIFGLKNPLDGSVNIAGSVKFEGDPANPVIDLKVNGSIYLETLMEFFDPTEGETIKGYAGFDGTVRGPVRDLKADGNARFLKGGGSFYGVSVEEAVCKVRYADNRLSFLDGKVKIYGGRARAQVWLVMPHINSFGMNIQYEDVNSEPLFKLISIEGFHFPKGKVRGELYSDGAEFDPSGWASYVATESGENAFERVKTIEATYNVKGHAVNITHGDVRTGHSKTLLSGTVMLDTKAIDFKGNMVTDDIRDLTAPFYRGLQGSGSFEGVATGTSDDPHFDGVIRADRVSVEGYPVGDARVEASYSKDMFVVRKAEGGDGQRNYRASGRITFPSATEILHITDPVYDMSLRLQGAELGGIVRMFGLRDVPLGGNVSTTLTLNGRGEAPELSGLIKISDALVFNRPIQSASFLFNYNQDSLSFKDGALVRDGATVNFSGEMKDSDWFEFKASSSRVPVKYLFATGIPIDHAMSFKAEGKGTFKKPQIDMNAHLFSGRVVNMRATGGDAELHIKDRSASFSAKLSDGDMKISGSAVLSDDLPWSARVTANGGRYDYLAGLFMKDIPEDLMLSVEGVAELRGTREKFGADLHMTDLNLMMYGQVFDNSGDIVMAISNRELSFEKFKIKNGDIYLGVTGKSDIGKGYDLALEGHSPLEPFRAVSDKINDLKGTGEFSVKVKGDWGEPLFYGTLSLADATLSIEGINQRLTSINGTCQLDGSRMLLQSLSAKIGGGDIMLSGFASFKGFHIDKSYVDARISRVTSLVSNGFVINVDGDILYRDIGGSRDITGTLTINRARYSERLEWKSWLIAARKLESSDMEKSWIDDVRLNLRVFGDNNISVENNIARTMVKVDLRLLGSIGDPLLFGRLEAKEGKVYFRNSEFRIINLTADYSNASSTDPYINVIAETLIQGYHIRLNMEGRLDKFDMILSSDPPLDEVEILSLLTLGKFGDNLRGLEGSIGAAEATSFITGRFQDVVEEKFKDITGLDRVQIDPYVAGSTSAVTPRVTVSKEIINDKLFVTYAAPVGSSEDDSLLLEFFLNDNVSLQGGRDERGSVGGDVKFRFKFK